MKVRCLSNRCLSGALDNLSFHPSHDITVGKSYDVYGLSFYLDSKHFGQGLFVKIVNDSGVIATEPIDLFEIKDGRIFSRWRISNEGDGINIWPDEFREKYFFDLLSDGDDSAVQKFSTLRDAILAEG
ncbi:hypothetical protein [Phaeospirillum tilakii]|uniref:Uncharacterized protein n=1 Tax=Phaeospirillum tilakii TaxID=741673 RepID=A0ABW5CBJ0_9PROT